MAVRVGFIFGKQPRRSTSVGTCVHSEFKMAKRFVVAQHNTVRVFRGLVKAHSWFAGTAIVVAAPNPRIVEPKLRQDMQDGRGSSAIVHGKLYQ